MSNTISLLIYIAQSDKIGLSISKHGYFRNVCLNDFFHLLYFKGTREKYDVFTPFIKAQLWGK
jgi:hypothetical protein